MIAAQFSKCIADLEKITNSQIRYVEKQLKVTDNVSHLVTVLEQRMVQNHKCPHCQELCSLINRHGKVNKMHRYGCKNFGKTFVAMTSDLGFVINTESK